MRLKPGFHYMTNSMTTTQNRVFPSGGLGGPPLSDQNFKINESECQKYVLKTVLDIVKIEIEENGFWSKIENTRTNKILKSIILPQDFNVKNIVQYLIYPIDIW